MALLGLGFYADPIALPPPPPNVCCPNFSASCRWGCSFDCDADDQQASSASFWIPLPLVKVTLQLSPRSLNIYWEDLYVLSHLEETLGSILENPTTALQNHTVKRDSSTKLIHSADKNFIRCIWKSNVPAIISSALGVRWRCASLRSAQRDPELIPFGHFLSNCNRACTSFLFDSPPTPWGEVQVSCIRYSVMKPKRQGVLFLSVKVNW